MPTSAPSLAILERAAEGCRDLGCVTHGQLVQRVHDIDRQLARVFGHNLEGQP